jgi:hypothetical protein
MWEESGAAGKGISILLNLQKRFRVSKLQNRHFFSKLIWPGCSIICYKVGVSDVHYISDCTRGSNIKCEIICVLLRPIEIVVVSTKYMECKQKYRVKCFKYSKCMLLKDKDYNTNFRR